MRMRDAVVLAVSLGFAAACSRARVVEDSAAACANKKDDDADGLVDCDDPDCAGTDACERSDTTCSNMIDDDGNGFVDCRQDSCKDLPICKDAVETQCQLRPIAEGTGCPLGKGCYITPDNRRWCALEGPSLAGGACGDTAPSDRSQGCAAGYLCTASRRCARICTRDYDCTRSSVCRPIGPVVSVCTLSCTRTLDCRADEECVPLQRSGVALEEGGWAHQCVPRGTTPEAGTAAPGELCSENPPSCAEGLLCVPEAGGNRCRRVCAAPPDGTPGTGCASGSFCYAVVPFSGQEDRFDEPYAIGVCLP